MLDDVPAPPGPPGTTPCFEPVCFGPGRRRLIRLALIGLMFNAISVLLLCRREHVAFALLSLLFFGAGTVMATVQLSRRWNRLELDRDAFTFVTLGRAHRYRWQDVTGDFSTHTVKTTDMITFSLDPPWKRANRLNKALYGHTHLEPASFERPAREIADLMTSMRRNILSGRSHATPRPPA